MNREIPGFYFDPEKKKYFKIQANHKAAPGANYSQDAVKRRRIDYEVKHQKKVQHNQRVAKEKIKKATSLANPLMGVDREIGTRCISKSARQEQQGLIYASQVRRKELHRFEPWPDEYSIRQVLRNQRSGILIASGYRGGESSVSVCFPDFDKKRWTYNQTMERVLFKEAYRLASISLSHTGYLLAAMDSGPSGDSFLAPRMLPDPDEGGDYRWPPFCSRLSTPSNRIPLISTSLTPRKDPHHTITMVHRSLPSRPQTALRNWHIRRITHLRGLRKPLVTIQTTLSQRRGIRKTNPTPTSKCTTFATHQMVYNVTPNQWIGDTPLQDLTYRSAIIRQQQYPNSTSALS
ncbi:hypothetical protein MW887_010082 [Aspergillus wentii]|nr:hypothetical protein MW887_010082 [Aspergillus wentii]